MQVVQVVIGAQCAAARKLGGSGPGMHIVLNLCLSAQLAIDANLIDSPTPMLCCSVLAMTNIEVTGGTERGEVTRTTEDQVAVKV